MVEDNPRGCSLSTLHCSLESESLAVLKLVKRARWICSPPSLQRQNHEFPQLSSYMDAGAQTQFLILAKRALHQRDHLLSSTFLFCYCLESMHAGVILPADSSEAAWFLLVFYSKQSQVTLRTFGLVLRTHLNDSSETQNGLFPGKHSCQPISSSFIFMQLGITLQCESVFRVSVITSQEEKKKAVSELKSTACVR